MLQNMAAITVASHRKVVSIANLHSIFPLQFTLPYFMEESPSADLQLLSRPHTCWHYFSVHN